MVKKSGSSIELAPDAWERFERAVNVVVKAPPQHKTAKGKSPVKKAKKKKR